MKTGFISDVNQIAGFLAERNIETLSRETLKAVSGQEQADAVLVFGNDLPYTAEFASEVFKKGIAKKDDFSAAASVIPQDVSGKPWGSHLHIRGIRRSWKT